MIQTLPVWPVLAVHSSLQMVLHRYPQPAEIEGVPAKFRIAVTKQKPIDAGEEASQRELRPVGALQVSGRSK